MRVTFRQILSVYFAAANPLMGLHNDGYKNIVNSIDSNRVFNSSGRLMACELK